MSSDTIQLRTWQRYGLPTTAVLLASLLILLIATVALVAVQAWLPGDVPRTHHLAVGSRESALLLGGVYHAETDPRSAFRWTTGTTQIALQHLGQAQTPVLHLQLGPPPPALVGTTLALGVNDQALASVALDQHARRYAVLLPPPDQFSGELLITLQSNSIAVPDGRTIGVRLEQVALATLDAHPIWPSPLQIVLQFLLIACCAMLLRRIGLGIGATSGVIVLIGAGLLFGYTQIPLLMPIYLLRLSLAAGVLTLLTYTLLPIVERYGVIWAPPKLLRAFWGIALLACALRLVGALYPPFDAYDLQLNLNRLVKTLSGTLVVTNRSIEFRNGVTVYPPGPYLAFLPMLLLGLTPKLLLQGGIAIFDGFGALTTALLARQLGLSGRAAGFSGLVFAAVPVGLTALWYGLSAQVFGQGLMAPLGLVLLLAMQSRDQLQQRRLWIIAGAVLSIALLSHIGVAILAVAWLGLIWLLVSLRRLAWNNWWGLSVMLAISCLVGFGFAYSPVVLLKLDQAREVSEKVLAQTYIPAYNLILRGWQIAFHHLGFLLLLPGLVLLWRRLPPGGPEVVGAWLLAVVAFWSIEMYSALQVRYIYFLTPLACILIGLTLAQLAQRRLASAIALVVLALFFVQGSSIWLVGTFENVAMSMVSLLR
jgi:hypothetical protein